MSATLSPLQQRFKDQISTSEEYLCILLLERETIAANQIEKLPELTEKKITLIEALTQTEIDILSFLKDQLGEEATEQPDNAIQTLDPNNHYQLKALLQKARELAAQCKRENTVNSQIIEACQNNVEQTLDILLGREKPAVYSAAGKTIKQGSGSLGEA